jgi:hypothetical protein
LDYKASFANVWKELQKHGTKWAPPSSKLMKAVNFQFLPGTTRPETLEGKALTDTLNLPVIFYGIKGKKNPTRTGPLKELYNNLRGKFSAKDKKKFRPPRFEDLLVYTRPNVADRTERFMTSQESRRGQYPPRLSGEKLEAMRMLLDPIHGFDNFLQDDETRWSKTEKLAPRRNRMLKGITRYANTSISPKIKIIKALGSRRTGVCYDVLPRHRADKGTT